MLKDPISITSASSLSAIGANIAFKAYETPDHNLSLKKIGTQNVWAGQLPDAEKEEVEVLRRSNAKYKKLDDSVLYAICASRKAVAQAGWDDKTNFGINIGSSRGATTLFEKHHKEFLKHGKPHPLASPTTTLGNISSWVAHDLGTQGPAISHSITCSTALHAVLNGVAWLQSGLADRFLVGGSEAPLTPFTIAQMQALKIYSKKNSASKYPCRALDLAKSENTMVLGEGAAVACLERGNPKNALAKIIDIGYATEPLTHNVSLSAEADCFQDSMKMALSSLPPDEVDAIVLHAPGTVKGDAAEVAAIIKVFRNKIPFLTTNKWKVGHTFGASGMLSMEMAILMLGRQKPFPVPFIGSHPIPKILNKIMVNAVGFGGNAVSILLSK